VEDKELYFWNGPLPETQAPAAPAPEPWGETKVVGKPVVRIDAYDRVSGSAIYPSDVTLPDMLHAAVLSCRMRTRSSRRWTRPLPRRCPVCGPS
jgi:xanthine dehydrogenase YagR molybdenum-binding subunit